MSTADKSPNYVRTTKTAGEPVQLKQEPRPVYVGIHEYQFTEKSRRDLFAAAALQGLCANLRIHTHALDIVKQAWGVADAMLEAER